MLDEGVGLLVLRVTVRHRMVGAWKQEVGGMAGGDCCNGMGGRGCLCSSGCAGGLAGVELLCWVGRGGGLSVGCWRYRRRCRLLGRRLEEVEMAGRLCWVVEKVPTVFSLG